LADDETDGSGGESMAAEQPPRAEVVPRPRTKDDEEPNPSTQRPSTQRPSTQRPLTDPGRLIPRPRASMVRVAPELARVAALTAWQAFSWSVGATVAGANYVTQRAADGESATEILQDAATDLRNVAWRALGVSDDSAGYSGSGRPVPDRGGTKASTPVDLQKRGTDLLRRSNDVHVIEDTHPAFARILTEITPDEARMLRFVYLDGPQPAIDVRTYRPFGIGSVLVASQLNMIGEHAGCRNLDRTSPYLTNLARLGLIEFSREQVANPQRYQVIEAQPKVTDALKKAGRMPRTVHRSIHLTSFGDEFVRACLPLNGRVVTPRPDGQADPDRPGR
jgi:hypothetical protein